MKYKIKHTIDRDYLETLLRERGITEIEEFFNPTERALCNPDDLGNIDEAAHFLIEVLKDPESKIHFIVDCDVDGFTSSAILWLYIKKIYPNANLSYSVHEKKQHGLQDMMHLFEDLGQKYDLVILPDASSNDYEYHKRLYELGIPVLVLDHHEAEEYSEHAIVVNNQLSTGYRNKYLSGAGVVYKFCEFLDQRLGVSFAKDYIDLAAFGIVSDMMDMRDPENRYIVTYGLNHIENKLMQAMADKQSYSMGGKINPTTVAFYMTPLINALIRVGSLEEKLNLFKAFVDPTIVVESTKRGEKGQKELLTVQVVRNCVNAKSRQDRAKVKMMEQLEIKIFNDNLDQNKIIVVTITDEDIDSSLTGLVAMQLMSKYKKPVLLVRENEEGFLRGSARNSGESDLKDLRQFLQDSNLIEYAEGHANAHGISIAKNNLEEFITYSNDKLADIDFNEGAFDVDFCMDVMNPDLKSLLRDICRYPDIWSQGNPEPLVAVKNVNITKDDLFIMGTNKDSVKFVKNGIAFVKFKDADFIDQIKNMDNICLEVVGHANANEWAGQITYQLIIEDYNVHNSILDF